MSTGTGRLEGVASDADLESLVRMSGQAFGEGAAVTRPWITAHRGLARLWRRDAAVAGGLLFIPMGQHFGGRAVPMTGVAGVCVAPGERGRGTATALMQAAVRELHREGVALSALYPATYALYRRAGYELAGGRYRVRVPARAIEVRGTEPPVREIGEPDAGAVERAYREHAASRPGWLDRTGYVWKRVTRQVGDREVHGYLVEGDGVEGYVYFWHRRGEGADFDLVCRDLVARTPGAARRLLALLAAHRSVVRDVLWYGGLDDRLAYLLPERGYEISLREHWMLRIIDVPRALAARGYPEGLEARLELEVADDVVAENQRRFVLEVSGGQGVAREGGRGVLRVDVRALASLYAGFLDARALAALGRLEGPERDVALAGAVFAGPPPSCPDYF